MIKMKSPLPSKKYLPRTLFGRAILMIVLPILLVQVVTSYLYLDRHLNSITRTFAQNIAADVAYGVYAIENTSTDEMKDLHSHLEHFFGIQVLASKNEIKISSKPTTVTAWTDKILRREIRQKIDAPAKIQSSRRDLFITVTTDTDEHIFKVSRRRLFNRTTPTIFIWSVISSLTILFVASLFMKNQVRAIERLARVAEKFGKGEKSPQFRPQGATEVRKLGVAFMEMQQRIKRQVQQRTDMLAGISHDLRTPLTRMKLQLALLQENEDVKDIQEDVREMEIMVEEFLDFARGDGGEKTQEVNFNRLIDDVKNSLTHEPITYSFQPTKPLQFVCRPLAFKRVLKNLLSNAARHADQAKIHVEISEKNICLIIEDNGPGIPEKLREDVFKPFFRVDSSRNAQTGGVGLGLSIAQDIVHSHGGQIELGQSQLGGLKVVIRLPR